MLHIMLIAILTLNSTTSYSEQLYNKERKDRQSGKIVEPSIIIVNYTTQATALESTLALSNGRASTHYIIDKDGTIYETLHREKKAVKIINKEYLKRQAWHAGHSYWKTDEQEITDVNSHSIGVLFVNEGAQPKHNPNVLTNDPTNKTIWSDFTLQQCNAFIDLCSQLKKAYNIDDKNIVGHGEIAISPKTKSLGRGVGPGPKFSWKALAEEGIGLYHNLSEEELSQPCNNSIQDLQQALSAFGYSVQITEKEDEQTKHALLQAQIHHDSNNIDGDLQSCRIPRIITNLLAQHRAKKTK